MADEVKEPTTPSEPDIDNVSFEDIQRQNAEYEAKAKEGLTNEEKSGNIEAKEKPQPEEKPALPIPDEWYSDGVPRSLKTMDDYHKWMVNQNTLRGKQAAEVEAVRREIAELRGAMGARQQPQAQPNVDIEAEWQPHLADKPVQTIAEITKRVVDAVLKNEIGTLKKDYDGKLSRYDQFLNEQQNRNARSSFLEKAKLSEADEKTVASIIEQNSDRYRKIYTDENGVLDTNGVLQDAYERFKAMKYDEMQNGIAQKNQKVEQDKTRAVVAPGTGKPPIKELEDIDKMSVEELEQKIQRSFR